MKFLVNGNIKKIELRTWKNNQYSPDFFLDVGAYEDLQYVREIDAYMATEKEYNNIVEYWKEEVEAANAGKYTEQFAEDYNVDELGELVLDYD